MAGGFSKQGKLRLIIAALILAAAVAGGFTWYFGYYTKTPEYSVRMMQEAVAKHDQEKFARYVNVENLVNTSCDALFEGIMDADASMNDAQRNAVAGYMDFFKAPLRAGFTSVIKDFVKTGEWGGNAGGTAALSVDSDVVVNKAGLKNITFRGIEGIEQNKEDSTAVVSACVFPEDVGQEFVLKGLLKKTEDGFWRLEEISNFREFIRFIAVSRQGRVKAYVEETDRIMQAHDAAIHELDKKFVDIVQTGNLSQDATRMALRKVMLEEILPDWQKRHEELAAVEVPQAAQTLHRLRLHICELRESYAKIYAEWLETKAAPTIRKANEMRRDVKEMESEAKRIREQMRAKGL